MKYFVTIVEIKFPKILNKRLFQTKYVPNVGINYYQIQIIVHIVDILLMKTIREIKTNINLRITELTIILIQGALSDKKHQDLIILAEK